MSSVAEYFHLPNTCFSIEGLQAASAKAATIPQTNNRARTMDHSPKSGLFKN
jgi:hypothetical protein